MSVGRFFLLTPVSSQVFGSNGPNVGVMSNMGAMNVGVMNTVGAAAQKFKKGAKASQALPPVGRPGSGTRDRPGSGARRMRPGSGLAVGTR